MQTLRNEVASKLREILVPGHAAQFEMVLGTMGLGLRNACLQVGVIERRTFF